MNASRYADLKALSKADLIAEYDQLAARTVVGLDWYRMELAAREAELQNARMLVLTEQMARLTIIMTVLTVANLAAVAYQLFFSG